MGSFSRVRHCRERNQVAVRRTKQDVGARETADFIIGAKHIVRDTNGIIIRF